MPVATVPGSRPPVPAFKLEQPGCGQVGGCTVSMCGSTVRRPPTMRSTVLRGPQPSRVLAPAAGLPAGVADGPSRIGAARPPCTRPTRAAAPRTQATAHMATLNYNHLLYFWMVAREGSIAAATVRLGVTQPAVSSQIAAAGAVAGDKALREERPRPGAHAGGDHGVRLRGRDLRARPRDAGDAGARRAAAPAAGRGRGRRGAARAHAPAAGPRAAAAASRTPRGAPRTPRAAERGAGRARAGRGAERGAASRRLRRSRAAAPAGTVRRHPAGHARAGGGAGGAIPRVAGGRRLRHAAGGVAAAALGWTRGCRRPAWSPTVVAELDDWTSRLLLAQSAAGVLAAPQPWWRRSWARGTACRRWARRRTRCSTSSPSRWSAVPATPAWSPSSRRRARIPSADSRVPEASRHRPGLPEDWPHTESTDFTCRSSALIASEKDRFHTELAESTEFSRAVSSALTRVAGAQRSKGIAPPDARSGEPSAHSIIEVRDAHRFCPSKPSERGAHQSIGFNGGAGAAALSPRLWSPTDAYVSPLLPFAGPCRRGCPGRRAERLRPLGGALPPQQPRHRPRGALRGARDAASPRAARCGWTRGRTAA